MKRASLALVASGLVVAWMGCHSATEPTSPTSTSTDTATAPNPAVGEYTLVTLKVPNMT